MSKPVNGNGQVAKVEGSNDTSERPFLAPPQPVREDQVQNAVNFLSHPKVKGSPVVYRRSFLEKKGLTKEEIDEAFRRVPDPPSNATSVEAVTTNQVAQPKHSASSQAQAPLQPPQPAGAPVSSAIVPSVQQPRFQWSHALVAAGVLAASGAGTAVFFKHVVVPRLKSWIRKVVAEEKESEKEDKAHAVLVDQTAEAAKAAAAAAVVVAKASEELLNSKNEERKFFEAFMSMMDVQVKEMKSVGEAIRKLESKSSHSEDKMIEDYISNVGNGTTNNPWRVPQVNQSDISLSSVPKQVKANGTANPDYAAGRPSSAPATVEPAAAPHPKSYMEIMAMIQRGERPPNIREINDMPPNPDQELSKPVLAPKPKPWEVSQQKPSYSTVLASQPSGEMLSSGNMENGSHDSSEPWWKKKTVKISEVESDSEETRRQQQQQPQPSFPYNGGGSVDRPVQRIWVPPQPPGVVVPEAAAAIRQPKSAGQKHHLDGAARSDDGEGSVAASDDRRTEGETSGTVFTEPSRSEIEEEQETPIEIC